MSTRWRGAVELALLAGAASASSAAAEPPVPPALAGTVRFEPPLGRPMLLSRTLWRGLADGKAIVATRRYRVLFARTASGWRVDGELVASEIDAPPPLAVLAEIERTRPDNGLFPLELDGDGQIVPGPDDAAATAPDRMGRTSVDHAVAVALERLAAQPAGLAAVAETRAFLQQIQALAAASVMSRWPPGLFLPARAHDRQEARFALPDGTEGLLVANIDSQPAGDAATMGEASREVATEIAGNRRETRERWTLTRATD